MDSDEPIDSMPVINPLSASVNLKAKLGLKVTQIEHDSPVRIPGLKKICIGNHCSLRALPAAELLRVNLPRLVST